MRTIDLDARAGALVLIDQARLPGEIITLRLQTTAEIVEAIKALRVRGAPAIGIAAAMAMYLVVHHLPDDQDPRIAIDEAQRALAASRPTAVNLFWALNRMRQCADSHIGDLASLRERMRKECLAVQREDEQMCAKIGEHGLKLLKPGFGILTHCNAGALAASRYGTALAPIYLGHERDYHFKVYADETRPLLQGARLTAFELKNTGIDVTILCDNMASYAMRQGLIDAVIVGADRIAKNGDTANKIGTSGAAVLAKHYGIPFYVCAPSSTLDRACASGDDIDIELRAEEEVTEMWYAHRMAPSGVKALNPAFDVTDAALITAIITESGVSRPPYVF